jgi:hypothetical protein
MKIKVYDFKTKIITEMPQEELAPGYVKATIQGLEGFYFVNAAKAKPATKYKHPVFGDEQKRIMRYLVNVFSDVHTLTAHEWEEGFRKDTNMDKEIFMWLQMAEVYQHFTASRTLSLEAKKDYLAIILTMFNSGLDFVRSLIDLQCLSQAALEEVVEYVQTSKSTAEYFEKYMGRCSE